MDLNMKDTHPDVEQLSGYMESPESSQHNNIRSHLMACDHCRGRVDKLAQLEFDIKRFVPRFSEQSEFFSSDALESKNSSELDVERFVDNQLDTRKAESVKQRISTEPGSLKAALHYAVHSSAMRKNIDASDSGINTTSETSKVSISSEGNFFSNLFRYLQWPAPVWAMAPATLLLAAIISLPLFYSQPGSQNTGPQIAKFQDNAVISYSSADIPAGSIGFFHDAKSRTEPFNGVSITLNTDKGLDLGWPAIEKTSSYQLKVFRFENGQKQELVAKTTTVPNTRLNGINWGNGRHYQWQITGTTEDGLKFSTEGDFLLINTKSGN